MKGRFLRHEPCPSCGSSDALAVYTDNSHCFSCGYHMNNSDGNEDVLEAPPWDGEEKGKRTHAKDRPLTPLPTKDQPAIKDRSISAVSVNKYKVTVNTNPESQVGHIYPYFDEQGNHVANKVRKKGEKAFYSEGEVSKSTLFGQTVFPPGGKAITIVEGECDALACFELTGSRYPCVSVKSASSAKGDVVKSFEYLNSFDKIVIAFDADEKGQKAAQEVAPLFTPGKVCILKLTEGKDANEYLMLGLGKKFVDEWFRAPVFMPDGLLIGSDPKLLEDIVDYKEPQSVPYPWEGVNRATYGLRLSELTLLLADTGIGKTTFCKEIEYKLLQDEDLKQRGYGVGFLHLEEPKRDTALGLMSIHKNKPYHLPDTEKSREELVEVYNEVINTNRVVIWDHFGSNDIDVVLAKIRHMAALGCKYIVVDHLSIIVSDQSGDERKQLDEISTKLKTLTMNLNICCICVMHINRQGQARGSAGPEQVANNVIRLERDKKEVNEWRRNITRLTIEKCRLSGRTGPASLVYYNPMTGRLEELTKEQAESYEQGGTGAGVELAF